MWRHNLVNKQLHYTNCVIFHEVKTNRHWNLVNQQNITREKISFKNYAKSEARRLELFLIFKTALCKVKVRKFRTSLVKAIALQLISIYFDSPQLGIQLKQTVWNYSLCIQRYVQFCFFRKESGNSFLTIFCVRFFKKNVSHVIFYQLTKFCCLITLTSCDIEQYVYCSCVLQLWRQRLRSRALYQSC